MIENKTKTKRFEGVWKVVYRMVETVAESEMGKEGREVVYWLIKMVSKSEVSELGRK